MAKMIDTSTMTPTTTKKTTVTTPTTTTKKTTATTTGTTLAAANNGGKTYQTTNVNNAAAVNGAANDGGNTGKVVDYSILDAIDKQVQNGTTGEAAVAAAKQAQAAEKEAIAANAARTQQARQTVTSGQPVSNPGDTSILDALDEQIQKGVTGQAAVDAVTGVTQPRNPEPVVDTPVTTGGNTGGNTGDTNVNVNTNVTNQNPTPTPDTTPTVMNQIGGQPAVQPTPTTANPIIEAAAEAAAESVGPYGQHSHDIAANETPSIQEEIEKILQEQYDKYGELTKQQIEYATQQAINNLQRQLEDATPTYNAERAKLAANQLNARDNLALKQVSEGLNGGIAAKQYSDQEAAYDQQMLNINLQQIQLSTDIGRQVADLEAQGNYEAAKALLEVGITKLQELQDAKQNYQSLRINQAQILDNYDMQSDQTNYSRALQRLQMGAFSAEDAAALGVDPSFAQEYATYINDLNKINAESARLQLEQQIIALDKARNPEKYAVSGSGGGAYNGGGSQVSNGTAETDAAIQAGNTGLGGIGGYSTEPVNSITDPTAAQMFRYGLDNGILTMYKVLNQNWDTEEIGTLGTDGRNYTINGKAKEIPFGALIALDTNGDGVADQRYYYDPSAKDYSKYGGTTYNGWTPEDWFLAEHSNWPYGTILDGLSGNDPVRTQNMIDTPNDEYGFATYGERDANGNYIPTYESTQHDYRLGNVGSRLAGIGTGEYIIPDGDVLVGNPAYRK